MKKSLYKCLVVDKDLNDRNRLVNQMRQTGLNIEISEAGFISEAAELMEDIPFDCIFAAYMLPDGNGAELVQKSKDNDIKTPVVIIVDREDAVLTAEIIMSGVSDYIKRSNATAGTLEVILKNTGAMLSSETDKKNAEDALRENQRALYTLMSNLPGMAYRSMPDKGRTIVFASEGCKALTGFDANSYLSEHIIYSNLIHPLDRKHVSDTISIALDKKERFQTTYRIFSREGALKWVWEKGCGVYTLKGELVAIEGFVTDITERVEIEEEITNKNRMLENFSHNLEKMVAERTSDLEQANAELVRLNRIKSEFLSVVSHELRTPLTSIKSFAEILLEDVDKLDASTTREYLGIINTESDRLSRLISELLDLQKIDAGKMTWNDTKLNMVAGVKKAINQFSAAFSEKDIELVFESSACEVECLIDQDRLHQVLSNILSNSLKFTEAGAVRVMLEIDDAYKTLLTTVEDSGIGIPEPFLEKIFERFYQVDNSHTREYSGTGLGLGICREIIEHYGGSIWAENVDTGGTRMCFSLPVVKGSADTGTVGFSA